MLTMYKTFRIKYLAGTFRPNGKRQNFFPTVKPHRKKLDQLRAKKEILHPRLDVIS
jgi:hypothetical protein